MALDITAIFHNTFLRYTTLYELFLVSYVTGAEDKLFLFEVRFRRFSELFIWLKYCGFLKLTLCFVKTIFSKGKALKKDHVHFVEKIKRKSIKKSRKNQKSKIKKISLLKPPRIF